MIRSLLISTLLFCHFFIFSQPLCDLPVYIREYNFEIKPTKLDSESIYINGKDTFLITPQNCYGSLNLKKIKFGNIVAEGNCYGFNFIIQDTCFLENEFGDLQAISCHYYNSNKIGKWIYSNDSIAYHYPYESEINNQLLNPKIPRYFKDVALAKQLLDADDGLMLSLMDSLYSQDKDLKAYYFFTFTQSLKSADGFYSEGAANTCYAFIKERTEEFVKYFSSKDFLLDIDLENWAYYTLSEIEIEYEDKIEENINALIKELNFKTLYLEGEQKKTLNKFISVLENEFEKAKANY